jgi:hypothetical protein
VLFFEVVWIRLVDYAVGRPLGRQKNITRPGQGQLVKGSRAETGRLVVKRWSEQERSQWLVVSWSNVQIWSRPVVSCHVLSTSRRTI